MRPRISLVTLGVAELARSRRFYAALGLAVTQAVEGEVAFFQLAGGVVLALYPRALLVRDARVPDANARDGFGGISLAQNTRSQAEVDEILAQATRAGAASITPGAKTSWAGYVGYFTDPDGHVWEIAWNPGFALDASGGIVLS
jgi:predicted lactoylglutathione lyase